MSASQGAVKRRKSAKASGAGRPAKSAASAVQLEDGPVRKRKFEFRRKLLHSSMGFIAMSSYAKGANENRVVNILLIPLCIITSADLLRFRSKGFARFYERVLGFLMRPSERESWNGTIWYLLGVIVSLTCFPRDVAVLAVVVLSWCDTAASAVGRAFGRYTPPLPRVGGIFAARKSVAGTAAAVAMGAVAAYVFFGHVAPDAAAGAPSWLPLRRLSFAHPAPSPLRLPTPASTLSLPALCVVVGIIAGLAEAIEICGLDDNLSLPVLAGFGIWIALFATSEHKRGALRNFFGQ